MQRRLTTVDPEEIAAQAKNTSDHAGGLAAVSALRRITDVLEFEQVQAAVAYGLSWQEIAYHLGVSRQAVHKKYSRRVNKTRTERPQ